MSIDATNGLQNLLGSIYKVPVVCIIMSIDTAHGLQNLRVQFCCLWIEFYLSRSTGSIVVF